MQFVPGVNLWARRLVSLVFPSTCLTCPSDVSIECGPVCAACLASVDKRGRRTRTTHLNECLSAFPFKGTLKELIHLYKYSGKDYLAPVLGKLVIRQWPQCPFETDAIVAVPMPYWRELRRGYNQADLLARELGKAWGKPVLKSAVKRRWNRSQTNLTRSERLLNAAKGFRLGNHKMEGTKHLLLVDDVLTTGATLEACAKLLKDTGASTVSALTLAYD